MNVEGLLLSASSVFKSKMTDVRTDHTLDVRSVLKQGLKRDIQARSLNHFCHGKTVIIVYSECETLALVFQHTKLIRLTILSSMACPAVPYFTYYL